MCRPHYIQHSLGFTVLSMNIRMTQTHIRLHQIPYPLLQDLQFWETSFRLYQLIIPSALRLPCLSTDNEMSNDSSGKFVKMFQTHLSIPNQFISLSLPDIHPNPKPAPCFGSIKWHQGYTPQNRVGESEEQLSLDPCCAWSPMKMMMYVSGGGKQKEVKVCI